MDILVYFIQHIGSGIVTCYLFSICAVFKQYYVSGIQQLFVL